MSMTTTAPMPLVPSSMDQAIRLADLMSRGKLVPSHFHNQPGDCLMVIEQAMRWGMSPFAVAQATSVIQGQLMFQGKLVAAALHSSGAMRGRLSYDYTGAGDDRAVTISGTLTGEDKPREVTVRFKDARTTNGMWTKQPDQQLAYHGARVWARRFAPEVMLGVYAPEEWETPPAAPAAPAISDGKTIDGKAEEVAAPLPEAPRKKTWGERLDEQQAALDSAHDASAVAASVTDPETQKLVDAARGPTKERLDAMLRAAESRTAGPDSTEALP